MADDCHWKSQGKSSDVDEIMIHVTADLELDDSQVTNCKKIVKI